MHRAKHINDLSLPLAWFSCLLIVFLSQDNFFFWDTAQLGSLQAQWIFDNGISSIFLPEEIDSGHFPLFGIYLASLWHVFGRALVVSHWAMLPFLLLITWAVYQLFKEDQLGSLLAILVLFSTTYFLGHSILISPDIVLVAFFLLSIYALKGDKKKLALLSLLLLSLISLRGFILVVVLFIWVLIEAKGKQQKLNLFSFFVFLPGLLSIGVFLLLHFMNKGWIGYHDDSPWAGSFETIELTKILRNIIIYIWRILDYGFFVIPIVWIALSFKKKKLLLNTWLRLSLIIIVTMALILISFQGLLNPRYFIPIQLTMAFGVIKLLVDFYGGIKWKPIAFILLIMISGNFWVYPMQISQGWDTTLAHVPFYHQIGSTIDYLDKNAIPLHTVGTAFPILKELDVLYLNGDKRSFKPFDKLKDNYILWSNVMNDFPDDQLTELFNNWKIEVEYKSFGAHTILFRKK